MKWFAPDYYPRFSCIADRCRHSCCIGWEIDIDEDTLEKYRAVSDPFGKRLRDGIVTEDGISHFRLCENERCPFLNEKGLCDIILTLGEDYLSQICTDHPRFCSFFSDRTEIGLGLCCEEAARMILSQKDKTKLILLEDDGEDECCTEEEDSLLTLRETLISIAQNREKKLNDRIDELLDVLGTRLPEKSFSAWVDLYLSLERMDEAWTALLEKAKKAPMKPRLQMDETAEEQLLVYFLYRHFSSAELPAKAAAFAVLSVKMIAFLCGATEADEEKMIEICRLYSSEIEYSEENTNLLMKIL